MHLGQDAGPITPEPRARRSGWPHLLTLVLESWPRSLRLALLLAVCGALMLATLQMANIHLGFGLIRLER